ncbi:MAG: PTS sugar transporter subunit IIA, partial [bacterium]|nr:PTS sugar transporter subunit IIA [Candidatus Colousia faecequi]
MSKNIFGSAVSTEKFPMMPAKLPSLIALLTKNVPESCRPAVANAVFPALGTLVSDVRFDLIDGSQDKEPTFMCVLMAKQSSGKSAVNAPIKFILDRINQRDKVNRLREKGWLAAVNSCSSRQVKPERPDDLVIQILSDDMTNAAFVRRLADARGRYIYTKMDELELLNNLRTTGTKDVGKIIRLAFDNAEYGQERVSFSAVTERVPVRWNW